MGKKFELKVAANNQFHFNLKAGNGQVILTSEMYTTKAAALKGINSVQTNAPHDNLYDRRESKRQEPYFVLKATNGQIIGNSEMYSSTSAMENGISSVKTNAPGAPVEDLTVDN
ncbi:YegP family protein [Acaryochloris marina]|uniref:DUF1508 domain-containing protein n=1 Tax=Acaryochloris marina (strain MBIC 11017) TaxID=329726 RepID=A8ZPG2_ACAM1|nr:YegP family protein [Acaryochloris marina]ABW32898.1 conserved hypothetical protein [Acaryochloris marina MBIC11017]